MVTVEERSTVISKRVGRNLFAARPSISVIIPAYNSAEHIEETLNSAINQRFRDHEIIVVNDGSPDTIQFERAIRGRLEDIIYIRQRNAGAGPARNLGIEHARGEFIAFLDADDIWSYDFLSSQYVFMQRHGYDMVYCDAELFGLRSAYRKTFMEECPSSGDANFDSLLDLRCNVITSGTLLRKQIIVDAGLFETARVRAHDFNLWLRIAKSGAKIGYQTKPLLKYRVHLDSLSGDAISRAERDIDAFERVRRDFDLTDEQRRRVDSIIAGFQADLAVEQGKSYLLEGNYREAALAFRVANRIRKSPKLVAVSLLARLAPRYLVKHYRSRRAGEIAFFTRH